MGRYAVWFMMRGEDDAWKMDGVQYERWRLRNFPSGFPDGIGFHFIWFYGLLGGISKKTRYLAHLGFISRC